MAHEISITRKRKMEIRWFDHEMKEVSEYT